MYSNAIHAKSLTQFLRQAVWTIPNTCEYTRYFFHSGSTPENLSFSPQSCKGNEAPRIRVCNRRRGDPPLRKIYGLPPKPHCWWRKHPFKQSFSSYNARVAFKELILRMKPNNDYKLHDNNNIALSRNYEQLRKRVFKFANQLRLPSRTPPIRPVGAEISISLSDQPTNARSFHTTIVRYFSIAFRRPRWRNRKNWRRLKTFKGTLAFQKLVARFTPIVVGREKKRDHGGNCKLAWGEIYDFSTAPFCVFSLKNRGA